MINDSDRNVMVSLQHEACDPATGDACQTCLDDHTDSESS